MSRIYWDQDPPGPDEFVPLIFAEFLFSVIGVIAAFAHWVWIVGACLVVNCLVVPTIAGVCAYRREMKAWKER